MEQKLFGKEIKHRTSSNALVDKEKHIDQVLTEDCALESHGFTMPQAIFGLGRMRAGEADSEQVEQFLRFTEPLDMVPSLILRILVARVLVAHLKLRSGVWCCCGEA